LSHFSVFSRVLLKVKARRGTVALVVALAAPMLLASTGLSVDVGFWYQQQESLQSAADTAAVAAALSDGVLGQTTASGKQAASQPLAVTAADDATNSQFGFAAGKGGAAVAINANLTSTNSSGESTVTTTQFTATAQAPRGTFFSSVSGVGVAGMVPGKQYASATTQTTSVYGPICLDATAPSGAGTIYTGNGASGSGFFGVNCGFYDNSTACGGGTNDAIVDSNTPMVIQATTIRTAGCAYSDFTNGINPGLGSVAQKQTSAPDPYGSMDSSCTSATTGSCMTWPAAASVSGNATCLTGEIGRQRHATSSPTAWPAPPPRVFMSASIKRPMPHNGI
jgi:Flp pilus assembly protein TadG